MKKLILPLLLLFIIQSFAQVAINSKWQFKGQLKDSSVKAFSLPATIKGKRDKDFLVYQRGNKLDTLLLNEADHRQVFGDNCQLTAIQIDGKGLKEVLLTFTVSESVSANDEPGKARFYKYEHTINEIWNLDSGSQLLMFTGSYFNYNKVTDYIGNIQTAVYIDSSIHIDSCYYSAKVSMDAKGTITLKNIKLNYEERCGNDIWIRKHGRGTFVFKGGKYVWISDKD